MTSTYFKPGIYDIKVGSTFEEKNTDSYYAFRYNFKPDSVDYAKDATLLKEADGQFSVEFQSHQDGETHSFKGTQIPSKEIECLLIYDEETGTFTLERQASTFTLKNVRRSKTTGMELDPTPSLVLPTSSTVPKSPGVGVTPTPDQDNGDEMELDLDMMLEEEIDKALDAELGELDGDDEKSGDEFEEVEVPEIKVPLPEPYPRTPSPVRSLSRSPLAQTDKNRKEADRGSFSSSSFSSSGSGSSSSGSDSESGSSSSGSSTSSGSSSESDSDSFSDLEKDIESGVNSGSKKKKPSVEEPKAHNGPISLSALLGDDDDDGNERDEAGITSSDED